VLCNPQTTDSLIPFPFIAWAEARDDGNADVDWILIGYEGISKTDMTLLEKGSGGLEAIANVLPPGVPAFGGVKLSSGKFVSFLYIDDDCAAMKRGRTLMYKNGMWIIFIQLCW
jgi:hypothetical protein